MTQPAAPVEPVVNGMNVTPPAPPTPPADPVQPPAPPAVPPTVTPNTIAKKAPAPAPVEATPDSGEFLTQAEFNQSLAKRLSQEQRVSEERLAKGVVKAHLEARIGKEAAAELVEDISVNRLINEDHSLNDEAVSALVDRLAPARRFQGAGDGGTRQQAPEVTIQQQIAAAQKQGDAQTVIALNNQLLAQAAQQK